MMGQPKGKDRTQDSVKISKRGGNWYHVKLTFFISFLSWPFTYFLNNGFTLVDEETRPLCMMVAGFLLLGVIVVGTAKTCSNQDWIYYAVTLFAFTGIIDLIISLEFTGVIHNFMSEYLKFGEQYLLCPFGSAIALFDGIGFYAMYLLIAYQLTNGKSWRSTGIYWGAGILNSMIVLLLGVWTGKHSATFCTLLNIPYVLVPVFALVRAFGSESRPGWNAHAKVEPGSKVLDIFLIFGFLGSMWLSILKGVAVLGSSSQSVQHLLGHEPALLLDDPAPYAAIQMLVFLFYLIPLQGVSLYYTLKSFKPAFLWEMTLIQAGACLQAQFSYIYLTLDPQTPSQFRLNFDDLYFWFVNLLILIVPHLALYRLSFHRRSSSGGTIANKSAKVGKNN